MPTLAGPRTDQEISVSLMIGTLRHHAAPRIRSTPGSTVFQTLAITA